MVCANETQTRLAEEQNTLKWKNILLKRTIQISLNAYKLLSASLWWTNTNMAEAAQSVTREEKASHPLSFYSCSDLSSSTNWGTEGGGGGQYRVSYPHPPPGKKKGEKKQNPATLLPNPGGLLYFQPPG